MRRLDVDLDISTIAFSPSGAILPSARTTARLKSGKRRTGPALVRFWKAATKY